MEKGFSTMHEKIRGIEGRVDNASTKLETIDKFRSEEKKNNL